MERKMNLPGLTMKVMFVTFFITLCGGDHLISTGNSTIQQFTFYESENCVGENITFFNSTSILTTLQWISKAESFSILGLWKIRLLNITEDTHVVVSRTFGQQPPDSFCYNSSQLGNMTNAQFQAVQTQGPSNLTESQIILYESTIFQQREYVVQKSVELLPQFNSTTPPQIQAILLISNDTWAIYAERNFTGQKTCICPTIKFEDNDVWNLPKSGFKLTQFVPPVTAASVRKVRKSQQDGNESECRCSLGEILTSHVGLTTFLATFFVLKDLWNLN